MRIERNQSNPQMQESLIRLRGLRRIATIFMIAGGIATGAGPGDLYLNNSGEETVIYQRGAIERPENLVRNEIDISLMGIGMFTTARGFSRILDLRRERKRIERDNYT